MKKQPLKLKTYMISYAVTRIEHYKITASNQTIAEQLAFCDGEIIEGLGETTGVETIDIEVLP